MFDYKPELEKLDGKDCPKAFVEGKQFAFIQGIPKLLGPQYPFKRAGQSGQWISDRLPHLETVIDDICFIKSMYTEPFNHGPAQLLMHTGSQNLVSASIGTWATYGLGSENQDLPLWLTPAGLLAYCAPFYPSWDRAFAASLARQLVVPLDKPLKACSRGMRMNAALVASLSYHPELLNLDEPFAGLDALAREEFASGLLEAAGGERPWTVFISSHDIDFYRRKFLGLP